MNDVELKSNQVESPAGAYPVDTPAVKTLLLVTDGTSEAETGITNSFRIACQNGSHLVITYYPVPRNAPEHTELAAGPTVEWRIHGQEVLARLATEARQEGVNDLETFLEEYRGQDELEELADQVSADLVVLAI